MRVLALSPINHDGELYQPGQAFSVRDADAKPLIESGAAEPADARSQRRKAALAAGAVSFALNPADPNTESEGQ